MKKKGWKSKRNKPKHKQVMKYIKPGVNQNENENGMKSGKLHTSQGKDGRARKE